ncbi:hypothetical protein SDRG_16397 [Saprolegnia diclina VS20]|uniref:Uncharacterized protein n=1 Tax=Saprolegnia diclina (strain VS20) TaxID=1156394 RepID=T0PU10_SAPDV|nr:hypothetical protein SDRG_16397 [Saprolegnia diclina VS20]EQC25736.1 hypothetical protein SDRG_16397 [Saprolegnia diclina VS20]|eukprot:XP_008620828.1 hypothetical protein SDRG_16397 [Saprolegnia diclina VS20]
MSYVLDILSPRGLLKQWQPAVLTLHEQTLTLTDKGKVVTTLRVAAARPLPATPKQTYLVEISPASGGKILTLAVTTAFLQSQLIAVVSAAAASPSWTLPSVSRLDMQLAVADASTTSKITCAA